MNANAPHLLSNDIFQHHRLAGFSALLGSTSICICRFCEKVLVTVIYAAVTLPDLHQGLKNLLLNCVGDVPIILYHTSAVFDNQANLHFVCMLVQASLLSRQPMPGNSQGFHAPLSTQTTVTHHGAALPCTCCSYKKDRKPISVLKHCTGVEAGMQYMCCHV